MKTWLILDPWNGCRWQWRYLDDETDLWFDLGPSFPSSMKGQEKAEAWLKEYEKEENDQ